MGTIVLSFSLYTVEPDVFKLQPAKVYPVLYKPNEEALVSPFLRALLYVASLYAFSPLLCLQMTPDTTLYVSDDTAPPFTL